jgi:plasmid stability protein
MKRLVIDIPEELHRRLKVVCTLRGKTMRQAAQEVLEEYVAKEEQRKLILYPKDQPGPG